MRKTIAVLFSVSIFFPNMTFAACATPEAYSIGTIDSRFNISKYDLVQDLQKAEAAWEEPAKRDLFTYVGMGGVPINFVYDSRQQEADREKTKIAQMDKIKATFDIIHAQFDAIATSTKQEQATNDSDFSAYKIDEDAYNADVAASNTRGGASGSELAAFSSRQIDLKSRFATLKATQDTINDKIRRQNVLAGLLNLLAESVNSYVQRYNASLKAMGEHEQGIYEEKNGTRTITIYEFTESNELIRALAHELGHSLGFRHVQDQDAIMYSSNTGSSLSATESDLTELNRSCPSGN